MDIKPQEKMIQDIENANQTVHSTLSLIRSLCSLRDIHSHFSKIKIKEIWNKLWDELWLLTDKMKETLEITVLAGKAGDESKVLEGALQINLKAQGIMLIICKIGDLLYPGTCFLKTLFLNTSEPLSHKDALINIFNNIGLHLQFMEDAPKSSELEEKLTNLQKEFHSFTKNFYNLWLAMFSEKGKTP